MLGFMAVRSGQANWQGGNYVLTSWQWRNAAPATPATPGGATLRGRQKGALSQRKVAPRFFLEFLLNFMTSH